MVTTVSQVVNRYTTDKKLSPHPCPISRARRLSQSNIKPAEAVLSDSNLVWAITQTLLLRRSKTLQSFDLKEWHALRSINAAFRDAVEGQPLTVHLSQQLDEQGKLCLQQTKLPIAEMYCCAGDQLVIQALLSRPYRDVHAAELVRVDNLYVDDSSGRMLSMAGPEFRGLESLTLSARADVHPLKSTLPFSSRWVGSLPALKHLKLRGYMLTELAHLPSSLESLDLGECKVTYEEEVALPEHLTLKQLALPQWGGKFSWMKAFPIPGL